MALRLNGSSSGYVELDVPADAGSHTLTLPNSGGSSGQYLQTNGSGGLSWQTVSSTEYQGPSFAATLSASQSISQSTWTKAQFDTELFDTDSCYDNSTNYRFTPTKAGYYQVNLKLYLDYTGSIGTVSIIGIYKNGSIVASGDTAGSNRYGVVNLSHILHMNGSTDYIEGYGYYNGTGAQFFASSAQYNHFSATWVHD